MTKEYQISIPEDLAEEMVMLQTFVNPALSDIGVLVMGDDLSVDVKNPVMRLYILEMIGSEYVVKDEMEAFTFIDSLAAQRFLEQLPQMSAIDLLLHINLEKIKGGKLGGSIIQ